MQIFTVQSIADRPLLTALANDDLLVIVDASDGNSVKRVALSVLKAFIGTTSPNPTPTPPPSNSALRVNCGGNDYVDVNGKTWLADFGFTGGNTSSHQNQIINTLDDTLYQTYRWGDWVYSFPVTSGNIYTVNFLFSDRATTSGARVFRIKVNGIIAVDTLDIFIESGTDAILIKSYTFTATSNTLSITNDATVDVASLNAVEILG